MSWQRVSLLGANGELQAPGHVAAALRKDADARVIVLGGHRFGTIPTYARLLCRSLAPLRRAWVVEVDPARVDADVLALARRSGCRAVIVGPDPDPLHRDTDHGDRLRSAAADLRRLRRAGLLTIVHLRLGRPGDDAGVFARAVRLCLAGRVAFPQLAAAATEDEGAAVDLAPADVASGIAWARRVLHGHRAIFRRVGLFGRHRPAALVASYRMRRAVVTGPRPDVTPAVRLARALARPIRVRERVAFVSTLVEAGGDNVRTAWLRARATYDGRLAALVIRLEGALDARAARTLVTRVRRAVGPTPHRIIIDLGGLERVSSTVLTRFLAEHAAHLEALRGRLAFRNLRPALEAVRRNMHGMLPNAALLEHALEES